MLEGFLMAGQTFANFEKRVRTTTLLLGDVRQTLKNLPDKSVNCVVTSPPYFGLRNYGVDGQIGLEKTPDEYVAELVSVFREVWRVLRDDGTLWLNLGDSYSKKQRQLIPAQVAMALQKDSWFLRDEIIWHKTRTTPAPVKDRTVASHESLFLLSKQEKYYFNYLAIEEPAIHAGEVRHSVRGAQGAAKGDQTKYAGRTVIIRNTRRKRSVWSVATSQYKGAHFAVFPPALIEPCVKAGCPIGGVVLDPFMGSGTTGMVANSLRRSAIGCELNAEYVTLAQQRIQGAGYFTKEVSYA